MAAKIFRRAVPFLSGWLLLAIALVSPAFAASALPDPFVMNDGRRVASLEDWAVRRSEIRAVLEAVQYGHAPPPAEVSVKSEVREEFFLEEAQCWAVRVTVTLGINGFEATAAYWRPRDQAGPFPVILANEPVWWPDPFVVNHVVDRVVGRGFILAGFYNNDFASFEDTALRAAQDAFPGFDWGVTAVGAWAYRTVMNWLEALPEVRADQVGIWGHSRGGKACILAGALDERFAAVIPHMSGMGGAAAYRVRGKGAQELEQLKEQYWLHPDIYAYIDREEDLPFDQHWLHALIAPRALYSHVGKEDAWGNPDGEEAAWTAAREVYEWLGVPEKLGIYFGDYGHYGPNWAEGADSWETALQFLEWQFRGKTPEKRFDIPLHPGAARPFLWKAPPRP